MFITEGSSFNGSYLVDVQAESVDIDNPHEAMIYASAIDEANFNAIMQPLAIAELTALREGLNPITIYTEGTLSSFWEKVKAFFKKVWAKIKGIFAKVMTRIDAQFKSGKSFWDKYKREITDKYARIDKDKLKFVGYNFTEKSLPDLKDLPPESDLKTMDSDAIDDYLDKYRGLCTGNSSTTASEFPKELFMVFRDGDSNKTDISDKVNVSLISVILSSGDKDLQNLKKNFKTIERACENAIKTAERNQKGLIDANAEVNKNTASTPDEKTAADENLKKNQNEIMIRKGKLAIAQQWLGACAKASSDRINQAKSFAGQILRAPIKESAGFDDDYSYDSNDIFGNVKLK